MKKTLLFFAAAFYLGAAHAQTAEEKAWIAFMTPGTEQNMLAKASGNWSEDMTMYSDPNSAPIKAKATCTNEMILGGRYQKSTSKGDMMGMPFEGVNIVGYDNARKIWVSSWIDNLGTGITYAEGTYDSNKKALVFKGKMTEPSSPKPVDFKQIFTMIDDDHQKIEMFSTMNDKEFKVMEILLTRVK